MKVCSEEDIVADVVLCCREEINLVEFEWYRRSQKLRSCQGWLERTRCTAGSVIQPFIHFRLSPRNQYIAVEFKFSRHGKAAIVQPCHRKVQHCCLSFDETSIDLDCSNRCYKILQRTKSLSLFVRRQPLLVSAQALIIVFLGTKPNKPKDDELKEELILYSSILWRALEIHYL